jgi:hypothetical protein
MEEVNFVTKPCQFNSKTYKPMLEEGVRVKYYWRK